MAITRTQQARQMLKKGSKKPVVQGGVDNYLGDQPQVVVPRKWQSGPDKPPTELAYITEAEKKLLLKEDIHGSLKEGPNKGPGGVMSLDSFGDIGGAGAAGVDTDPGGGYDTGPGGGGFTGQGPNETRQDFENRKDEQRQNLEKIKAQQEEKAKQMRKEARATRRKMSDLKKADRKKRQQRIRDILSGKFGVNNPFGLSPTELADLQALGYDPTLGLEGIGKELGAPGAITGPNEFTADILNRALEKSDRLSGVNLETFQNRTMDDIGAPSLPGPLLSILRGSGLIDKGMKVNRKFFSDRDLKNIFGKDRKSVLEAGKLTYDGLPISQSQFEMLSPAEMEEVYGDYMDRRSAGEIDAYGNPIIQRDDSGPSDPCKGPNPPAYCFIGGNAPTTPDPVFTPAFRFMNRGGMVEDAPMGGIMDLETTRQMLFLGGIAKGIKKGLKSVTRGLKKVAKSPLGKAALLGTIGYGLGGGFSAGGFKLGNLPGAKFFSNMTLPKLITDNMTGLKVAALSGLGGALLANVGKDDNDDFDIEQYYKMAGIDIPSNQYRFLAEGGRVGLQEGGGIEQRLEQLGGDVTSAEQTLQEINQRLESAESNLGSGGGGLGTLEPGVPTGLNRVPEPGTVQKTPTQLPGIRPDFNVQLRPGFANRPLLESLVPPTGTLEQPKAVQPANRFSSLEDAFADAQKNAQEARAGGFLGRAVLPGEMSFENFSNMFTPSNNFGQPMQLPASGELGGAMISPIQQAVGLAEGGKAEPVAKKTMPLLDLDGQEMDFRAEGGFVPIGRMEKADDVPARLSKNEFVFTAEAVRNAGGGDVDKGAEVMYNTMKNLEAGGEVSEETQGLEGARKMFQTSQRLGEVI